MSQHTPHIRWPEGPMKMHRLDLMWISRLWREIWSVEMPLQMPFMVTRWYALLNYRINWFNCHFQEENDTLAIWKRIVNLNPRILSFSSLYRPEIFDWKQSINDFQTNRCNRAQEISYYWFSIDNKDRDFYIRLAFPNWLLHSIETRSCVLMNPRAIASSPACACFLHEEGESRISKTIKVFEFTVMPRLSKKGVYQCCKTILIKNFVIWSIKKVSVSCGFPHQINVSFYSQLFDFNRRKTSGNEEHFQATTFCLPIESISHQINSFCAPFGEKLIR